VFGDRHGGVSTAPFATGNVGDHVGDDPAAVLENRRRFARSCGAGFPRDPGGWVWLRQRHGPAVHVAGAPTSSSPPDADAAATDRARLPLAVVSADCAPVALLGDTAVAMVHAGHRGLIAGVLERAVDALGRLGSGRVRALIGPCICPAHYAIGPDDLARVVATFGPTVEARTTAGRPALDLRAAARVSLGRGGVTDVDDVGVCTFESPDHFSHRRERPSGRQASAVALAP
jgi:YfiH family protein